MTTLEKEFDALMLSIYNRAKDEANYNATIFYQMLDQKGGVTTANDLINRPQPSDGYTALWEKGYLHLTVEAQLIENEKFHTLFVPQTIEKARQRLRDYRYKFKNSNET